MEYISFVESSEPRIIESVTELTRQIELCRRTGLPLQNLDLRKIRVCNMDMSNLYIYNVIFNSYKPSAKKPKKVFNVNFKGSILEKVCFSYCSLERCNFDTDKTTKRETIKHFVLSEWDSDKIVFPTDTRTILKEVDFFFCQFYSCRFRNTKFKIADFRYSKFTDCSLSGCDIYVGDFYMASFCGTTSFHDSKFRSCSITNTTFEQHCPSIFNIIQLAQEDYRVYHDIIIGARNWSKHNPCAGYSCINEAEDNDNITESKIHNYNEAYRVYATLSGIYNGKGFFRESNQAYRLAKKNEAAYNMASAKKDWKEKNYNAMFKHLLNRLSIGISWCLGYGYKIPFVFFWLCVLVIGFGTLYKHSATETIPLWSDSFANSLNNTLGPLKEFADAIGAGCASIQTAIGILLVGFIGFVMANRIRNNA